jgi:hypothetical protein
VKIQTSEHAFFIASITHCNLNLSTRRPGGLVLFHSIDSGEYDISPYDTRNVVDSMKKTLQDCAKYDFTMFETAVKELTVSPGQQLFLGPPSKSKIDLAIHENRQISHSDLSVHNVSPYFNSFILPSAKPAMIQQLSKQGYQLVNSSKNQHENFTTAYLKLGKRKLLASATMALDSKLCQLATNADPRLSKAKGEVIEQILKAATIEEVLKGPGSIKMNFYAHSLQVQLNTIY